VLARAKDSHFERVVTCVRPLDKIFGYPDTPRSEASQQIPRYGVLDDELVTRSEETCKGEPRSQPITSIALDAFVTNQSSYWAIYPSFLCSQSWIFSSVAVTSSEREDYTCPTRLDQIVALRATVWDSC
jgi:hypothetical protein